MRTPSLVAAVSAVALLPALALAPAATAVPAAKAVKVTIENLPASSDVGTKLTVAGTAKDGTKKVKVTVQRRYGAGAWQAVGSDTTDKKGKYSLKVPLVQGGPTSFRVKVGSRTSPVESLAVYEWLDLAAQPQVLWAEGAMLHRRSVVGGTAYPDGYEFPSGGAFITVKTAGLCTAMTGGTGILDTEAAQVTAGGTSTAILYGYTPGTDPVTTELEAPVGPAVTGSVSLVGKKYALASIGTNAQDMDAWSATLLSPRLRCNASRLPGVEANEVPV